MSKQCDIIRDLLPLYADEVLSDASREIVDAHLAECADCADYLKQIRASEVENELKDEKALVIQHQARRFKRRSAAVGSLIAAIFMIPILISLIVNLSSGRALDWFFIVAAGMLVTASLVVVPLMAPESKGFWTLCAFYVSLVILLAVCALYTRGGWFPVAASASLFGLAVVFLPFAIKAKPIQKWVEGRNKALLVIALDVILFANMMNMISLHSKSIISTLGMVGLCIAGIGLLAAARTRKETNENE